MSNFALNLFLSVASGYSLPNMAGNVTITIILFVTSCWILAHWGRIEEMRADGDAFFLFFSILEKNDFDFGVCYTPPCVTVALSRERIVKIAIVYLSI
uniref:Haloacid dehalogenase-like hydrolase family protein n=1 Tax=Rhizophora mucronata TaxID=61149 RepID=A0A2P2KZ31_RHIMU